MVRVSAKNIALTSPMRPRFAALSKAGVFAQSIIEKYGNTEEFPNAYATLVFLRKLNDGLAEEDKRRADMNLTLNIMVGHKLVVSGGVPDATVSRIYLKAAETKIAQTLSYYRGADRSVYNSLSRAYSFINASESLNDYVYLSESRYEDRSDIYSSVDMRKLGERAFGQDAAESGSVRYVPSSSLVFRKEVLLKDEADRKRAEASGNYSTTVVTRADAYAYPSDVDFAQNPQIFDSKRETASPAAPSTETPGYGAGELTLKKEAKSSPEANITQNRQISDSSRPQQPPADVNIARETKSAVPPRVSMGNIGNINKETESAAEVKDVRKAGRPGGRRVLRTAAEQSPESTANIRNIAESYSYDTQNLTYRAESGKPREADGVKAPTAKAGTAQPTETRPAPESSREGRRLRAGAESAPTAEGSPKPGTSERKQPEESAPGSSAAASQSIRDFLNNVRSRIRSVQSDVNKAERKYDSHGTRNLTSRTESEKSREVGGETAPTPETKTAPAAETATAPEGRRLRTAPEQSPASAADTQNIAESYGYETQNLTYRTERAKAPEAGGETAPTPETKTAPAAETATAPEGRRLRTAPEQSPASAADTQNIAESYGYETQNLTYRTERAKAPEAGGETAPTPETKTAPAAETATAPQAKPAPEASLEGRRLRTAPEQSPASAADTQNIAESYSYETQNLTYRTERAKAPEAGGETAPTPETKTAPAAETATAPEGRRLRTAPEQVPTSAADTQNIAESYSYETQELTYRTERAKAPEAGGETAPTAETAAAPEGRRLRTAPEQAPTSAADTQNIAESYSYETQNLTYRTERAKAPEAGGETAPTAETAAAPQAKPAPEASPEGRRLRTAPVQSSISPETVRNTTNSYETQNITYNVGDGETLYSESITLPGTTGARTDTASDPDAVGMLVMNSFLSGGAGYMSGIKDKYGGGSMTVSRLIRSVLSTAAADKRGSSFKLLSRALGILMPDKQRDKLEKEIFDSTVSTVYLKTHREGAKNTADMFRALDERERTQALLLTVERLTNDISRPKKKKQKAGRLEASPAEKHLIKLLESDRSGGVIKLIYEYGRSGGVLKELRRLYEKAPKTPAPTVRSRTAVQKASEAAVNAARENVISLVNAGKNESRAQVIKNLADALENGLTTDKAAANSIYNYNIQSSIFRNIVSRERGEAAALMNYYAQSPVFRELVNAVTNNYGGGYKAAGAAEDMPGLRTELPRDIAERVRFIANSYSEARISRDTVVNNYLRDRVFRSLADAAAKVPADTATADAELYAYGAQSPVLRYLTERAGNAAAKAQASRTSARNFLRDPYAPDTSARRAVEPDISGIIPALYGNVLKNYRSDPVFRGLVDTVYAPREKVYTNLFGSTILRNITRLARDTAGSASEGTQAAVNNYLTSPVFRILINAVSGGNAGTALPGGGAYDIGNIYNAFPTSTILRNILKRGANARESTASAVNNYITSPVFRNLVKAVADGYTGDTGEAAYAYDLHGTILRDIGKSPEGAEKALPGETFINNYLQNYIFRELTNAVNNIHARREKAGDAVYKRGLESAILRNIIERAETAPGGMLGGTVINSYLRSPVFRNLVNAVSEGQARGRAGDAVYNYNIQNTLRRAVEARTDGKQSAAAIDKYLKDSGFRELARAAVGGAAEDILARGSKLSLFRNIIGRADSLPGTLSEGSEPGGTVINNYFKSPVFRNLVNAVTRGYTDRSEGSPDIGYERLSLMLRDITEKPEGGDTQFPVLTDLVDALTNSDRSLRTGDTVYNIDLLGNIIHSIAERAEQKERASGRLSEAKARQLTNYLKSPVFRKLLKSLRDDNERTRYLRGMINNYTLPSTIIRHIIGQAAENGTIAGNYLASPVFRSLVDAVTDAYTGNTVRDDAIYNYSLQYPMLRSIVEQAEKTAAKRSGAPMTGDNIINNYSLSRVMPGVTNILKNGSPRIMVSDSKALPVSPGITLVFGKRAQELPGSVGTADTSAFGPSSMRYLGPQTRAPEPQQAAPQAPSMDALVKQFGNLIEGADAGLTPQSVETTSLGSNSAQTMIKLEETAEKVEMNTKLIEEIREKQKEIETTVLRSTDMESLSEEMIKRLRSRMRFDRSRYM